MRLGAYTDKSRRRSSPGGFTLVSDPPNWPLALVFLGVPAAVLEPGTDVSSVTGVGSVGCEAWVTFSPLTPTTLVAPCQTRRLRSRRLGR